MEVDCLRPEEVAVERDYLVLALVVLGRLQGLRVQHELC